MARMKRINTDKSSLIIKDLCYQRSIHVYGNITTDYQLVTSIDFLIF